MKIDICSQVFEICLCLMRGGVQIVWGVTDEGEGGGLIKGVRIHSTVLEYHRKILYGSIIIWFLCNIVPFPWRRLEEGCSHIAIWSTLFSWSLSLSFSFSHSLSLSLPISLSLSRFVSLFLLISSLKSFCFRREK